MWMFTTPTEWMGEMGEREGGNIKYYSRNTYSWPKPIKNLHGDIILIRLGLNFDHAGTNNVMTHVPSFDTKVRRNEKLKTSGYSKL